jgi:hypothetical protein
MSWSMHHTESERYASQAEAALREGNSDRAAELYAQAAQADERALNDLDKGKKRTLGITAVSAASLWYKARDFRKAENVAYQWLSSQLLPPFAIDQLQDLLQTIWSEELREKAGVKFTQGEVLVSVSGGEVIKGGAPLELILRKVNEVSKLFYRTVEMLLDLPLRKHGDPSVDIQQQCRPWLFQAPAGSYQFAVRVEHPKQLPLPTFGDAIPKVEQVTQKFLEIIQASVEDPEAKLAEVVPDAEYRATFLKLTRNLAPTDKSSFGQVEIKPAAGVDFRPIVLRQTEREVINKAIRFEKAAQTPPAEKVPEESMQLVGVLRGLQLDEDWIDLEVAGEEKDLRIYEASEGIDDVIGPMVNHRVIVDVVRKPNGRYAFRDIQSEE